jgi:hypothetical protein
VILLLVALAVLFVAVRAAYGDAPPKADTPENWKAWEVYSRTLLVRMYPERAASLGERPLVVVGMAAPDAYRRGRTIVITLGIIVTAEDDAEYASVLARLIDGYGMRARIDNPYCAMVIRREAVLLRTCAAK